jgi:hypothetical protein
MALLLSIILVILFVGQILLYLRPKNSLKVNFKDGITPSEMTGEVTKKDRYVVIKPDGSSEEQVFTWDQIRNITGTEPSYSKRIDELADLFELVAKLGVLAAAGVFLIGLYQFDVGQRWKREEFLAGTVNDFGRRATVENAKKMLELLMFYPQGRRIPLFSEDDEADGQHVTVEDIRVALDPAKTEELNENQMKIRECFDSFFSRLERFEHYIESDLIGERSVYIYLSFWLNALLGETKTSAKPLLSEDYRKWLMNYVRTYDFLMLESLLDRFRGDRGLFEKLRRLRMNKKIGNKPSDPSAPIPGGATS